MEKINLAFIKKQILKIKEILLFVLTISIVCFLSFVFLVPKAKQLIKLHTELKKDEKNIAKLEKKASFLSQQKKGTLYADFEKISLLLPHEKDVAALLINLDFLKQELGLDFERLDLRVGTLASPGARLKKRKDKTKNIQFTASFTTSYEKLIKFLERIEKIAPLTSVERANLSFSSGRETVKAKLSFRTYHYPLAEHKFQIAKSLPEFSSSEKEVLKNLKDFEFFSFAAATFEEDVGKKDPFAQETVVSEELPEPEATESASFSEASEAALDEESLATESASASEERL